MTYDVITKKQLDAFKADQRHPEPLGLRKLLAGAENDSNLSKVTRKKKKVRAIEHPQVQQILDRVLGPEKRKKLQAKILREKARLAPNNGHYGAQRAVNPVEEPDDDPVEHVKGLGIGPNTANEVALFKRIHRRDGVWLSRDELIKKGY